LFFCRELQRAVFPRWDIGTISVIKVIAKTILASQGREKSGNKSI